MEMMAKDWMVTPITNQLKEKFGDDFMIIAYMNTSGRLKAIAGETGGAVCTSSNASLIVDWARKQGKRILFVPDEHLGRNTASQLGMDVSKLVTLPNPTLHGIDWKVDSIEGIDECEMMLWGGYCGVHTIFNAEQVYWWKSKDWQVLIHPESPIDAVQVADGFGSTAYLWNKVMESPAGSKFAVGTEGHFVRNLKEQASQKGILVEHLADAKIPETQTSGCGCATMSRNDPPHLAGMLDLLRKGEAPDLNMVLAGDTVDEQSGTRGRLNEDERQQMIGFARSALHKMIEITESAT